MAIKTKKAGAYSDPVGIFTKKGGVYAAVQGVYVKSGGAYTAVSAASDSGPFVGLKGTNLGMPFQYGIATDANNLYGTNVYSPTWASGTKNLLPKIAAAGHDHVRFNFQPGPFLEAIKNGNATRLNQLFGFLTAAIDDTIAAGLNVFLTPHVNNENPLWANDVVLASQAAPEYGYYKTLLQECATRYKSYPTAKLSLSIFNEPSDLTSAATWQAMAENLYDAVRAIMPKHTLILTGAANGALNGMTALNMAHFDANTRPTFHFYEPQEFTFQAQTFTAWKYITTNLPWPVPATSLATHLTTANANVDADGTLTAQQKTDKKAINAYFINEEYGDYARVKINARFADIARWCAAQGIPASRVYMGEFGCNSNLNIADQAQWFMDVRLAAESYGMGWNSFIYDSANYQLSDGAGNLKSGLVSAFFGSAAVSTEAAAIVAAMTVPPPAGVAAAIDRVIQHLKDGGIWTTGGSLVMPVAHTLQAALVDWISPARAGVTTGSLTFVADKYVAGSGSGYRNTAYRMGVAGSKFRSGSATMAYLKLGGPDGDGDIGSLNGNNTLSRQTGYAAAGINTYTVAYPGVGVQPTLGNRGMLSAVSSAAGSYTLYDWDYTNLGTTNTTDAEDQADFTLWRNTNGYSTARIGGAWVGSSLTRDQVRVLGICMQSYAQFKGALWA